MKTSPKPALPLKSEITIGEKYGYAMSVTDQAEADAYFEACVQHTMSFGKSREEAEKIERSNIGYYGGYYDHETMARTQRLFRCAHPVFGAIAEKGPPTPDEALNAGLRAGYDARRRG